MSQKTKIIAFMVFKIVCVIAGLLFWFVGFYMFGVFKEDMGWIVGWLIWGLFTVFALPFEFLKSVIKGANEGAIEGANTFKIRDYGSSFTVSNSVAGGTLKGMITSALASILVGPVILGFKIIANLFVIINCIIALRKINSADADH